jgi:transcriptional regulator
MKWKGAASMYIPAHFAMNDQKAIFEFIEQNSFGIVVSCRENVPIATHLPLMLDRLNERLTGHFARANDQWEEIDGQEVLAIFHGPHHYISSSWYETNQSVPTWNYVSVHVYGTMELVQDEKELFDDLQALINKYEGPGRINDSNMEFVQKLMKAIVGFRIKINRLEGKWKLSQNHPRERQLRVISALEELETDNAARIAELMRKHVESVT